MKSEIRNSEFEITLSTPVQFLKGVGPATAMGRGAPLRTSVAEERPSPVTVPSTICSATRVNNPSAGLVSVTTGAGTSKTVIWPVPLASPPEGSLAVKVTV